MKNYRLSADAFLDLKSIWDYTKQTWSEAQAEKYTNSLFDILEILHPKESKKISTQPGEYFLTIFDKHVILYRLRDNNTKFVLRILHRQMDLDKHLKNL